MSNLEKECFSKSAELWNNIMDLDKKEVLRNDDKQDVLFHIHAIQNIILARSAFRELNNGLNVPA